MSEITLLRKKYAEGNRKLSILEKYGMKSAISDFSILLGGNASVIPQINVGTNDEKYTGDWVLNSNTNYVSSSTNIVLTNGKISWTFSNDRSEGIRPVTNYSKIEHIVDKKKLNKEGILEIEYGEYPQTVVDEKTSNLLETLYRGNNLTKTGKSYTTDSVSTIYKEKNKPFTPRKHIEYEYQNERYIRIKGDASNSGKKLSDGREIKDGSEYWVKVEPIKWLVDEKSDIALSKDIIVSGIRINEGKTIGYEKSEIKKFLDKCFYKEILTKRENALIKQNKTKNYSLESVNKLINKKCNFSLLEYEEAFDGDTLKVPISRRVELTDFASALGCMQERSNGKNFGPFWTKAYSTDHNHMEYSYDYDDRENVPIGTYYADDYPIVSGYFITRMYGDSMYADSDFISSVIKVPYGDIKNLITEKKYKQNGYSSKETGYKSISVLMIKAGEYPQTIVSEDMKKELDRAEKQGNLIETGKTYSINGSKIEYEYKGKKYIKHSVISDKLHTHRKEIELSDGKKYKTNDEIWIEVEPIEWMVSEETGLAVTKKGLIAGIQFDKEKIYLGDFDKTTIKQYLNDNFAKEIIPSKLKNPKTNYSFEEIENDEYLRKEISEMTPETKKQVVASLTEELKEKIEKIREYTKELDEDFGKVFDQEMQKDKTKAQETTNQNKEPQKVKVKVKVIKK